MIFKLILEPKSVRDIYELRVLLETILAIVITIFESFIKKVLLSENGILLSIENYTNLIQVNEQKI